MTPISITNKANCHRKTHRINIPIQVIIANTTYSVLDWSTQGLKVNYPSDNLNIDEKIDITFILPTGDSSILLKAEVILRSINHEDYGFEILKLSDKNQRVLRHYATLSIDGNHNHVDNLSGDLFMTDVISPIHEPIVLSEKEHHAVHKSFLKRVISYLFFGILFFILVIVTFFYNYIILYESTGLISGNAKHYSAPKEGMLKAVYVTNAQKLTKNQLLFEMDVRIEEDLLKNLRKHKALLKKQLQRAKAMIRDIKRSSYQKSLEIQKISEEEKKILKSSYQIQEDTYNRATYLYDEHLITLKKYTDMQNQYLSFMSHYNDVVLHNNSTNKNKLLLQQGLLKSQDQKISIQKSIDKLNVDIKMNELEIIKLQEQIRLCSVVAQEDASVHNIFHKNNTYLEYADNVLTLEIKQKPYVLTKMLSKEIANIHLGGPCILYSKREKKSYRGHIIGIGYSVTEGVTTNTTEISQNEIPIRIEFDNPQLRFHLNEYLEVYLINDSAIARKIIEFLPQGLIVL